MNIHIVLFAQQSFTNQIDPWPRVAGLGVFAWTEKVSLKACVERVFANFAYKAGCFTIASKRPVSGCKYAGAVYGLSYIGTEQGCARCLIVQQALKTDLC